MNDGSPVQDLMESDSAYSTDAGAAYHGDSRQLLKELPDNSIDLIVTSPPFALQHQKEYGNENLENYNDWFLEFVPEVKRVLQPHGSFVVEIGGAFERGRPERSTYQYELLTRLTDGEEDVYEDDEPLHLAQDFFWHNPAKLPNPIEWVNVRKIRVTDAVTQIWWLAKDINKASAVEEGEYPHPEANNQRVLQEYSDSQKELMESGEFNDGKRPSGWDIDPESFANKNEGSIPDNLITASNTASNTHYLQMCREFGFDSHPARFPRDIPEFFVQYLTPDPPYDEWNAGHLDRPIVLDIFAGSNITGEIAEKFGRHWLSFEREEQYVKTSELRFRSENEIRKMLSEDQSDFEDFAEVGASDD